MLAEIRAWGRTRRIVATGVALAGTGALLLASGLLFGGPFTPAAELWWAAPLILAGSLALGALIASYIGAPIGAEATFCDLRWPLLAIVLLHLATDFFSVAPLVAGPTRLILGAAATLLLLWALRERVRAEQRARTTDDGATCTTCRPLIATRRRSIPTQEDP